MTCVPSIYPFSTTGTCYALSKATGDIRWSKNLENGAQFKNKHLISSDESRGFAMDSFQGAVYAFNLENGSFVWETELLGPLVRPNDPVLSPDGATLYVPVRDGIQAISTGKTYRLLLGALFANSPEVDNGFHSHMLQVAYKARNMCIFTDDSSLVYYTTPAAYLSPGQNSLGVSQDGSRIYVINDSGEGDALNASAGTLLESYTDLNYTELSEIDKVRTTTTDVQHERLYFVNGLNIFMVDTRSWTLGKDFGLFEGAHLPTSHIYRKGRTDFICNVRKR